MEPALQPAEIRQHSHRANRCGSSGPRLRGPEQLRWPKRRSAWHRASAQPGAPSRTGKFPAGMQPCYSTKVTLLISFTVVMPARILASPLSRSVIMPSSHATLDLRSRTAIHDHFPDAVGQVEQFANRRPAWPLVKRLCVPVAKSNGHPVGSSYAIALLEALQERDDFGLVFVAQVLELIRRGIRLVLVGPNRLEQVMCPAVVQELDPCAN